MLNEILSLTAAETVKKSVGAIMDKWVLPKLEAIKTRRIIDTHLETSFVEVFSDYIARAYERYKFVNTIALGNNQIDIDQIYCPLSISSENSIESYYISDYDSDFFNKYKKIIIEDNAGMGKSTIMKKLFTSCIEKNEGIPIFIELRKLHEEIDIVNLVVDQLNSIHIEHDKQLVLEMINRGDFIFFLDGFDEIPFDSKDKITHKLKEFMAKTNNNIFILTSRNDNVLFSFGQFKKFHINGLKINESHKLIEKYDKVLGLDLSNSIIKQINKNIKLNAFNDLEEFLKIPFLVSLIYLTYKHKKDVPLKKDQFYRKVYDALFEEHDLSKDGYRRQKYSGLSIDQLHKLLRKLGYLCLRENRIEYNKDKLISLIEESIDSPYFENIKPHDVFKDLIYNVPLIIAEGLTYRWTHKSFIEYFSAQFIYIDYGDKKKEILNNIMKSKKVTTYLNMLDLYFDIDQETFDIAIIYPLLKNYTDYIGDVSQYKSEEELFYKEFMYGKTLYFRHRNGEEPGGTHAIHKSDALQILKERYSVDEDFFNTIIFRYSMSHEMGIFGEESNAIQLFTLLKNKKSKLLETLEMNGLTRALLPPGGLHVISYLDVELNESKIRENIDYISNTGYLLDRD
ncbi:TPA: NACHT domain-containing protein, partial [Bacillus thuringiensis]|nr:NACHT domain-containing protein [Bacillus thuringiensis]